MRSHVDDRLPNGCLFARLEYEVTTPLGNRLIVMINHLKSRVWRRGSVGRQAQSPGRAYEGGMRSWDAGTNYIAVIGDLNDTPASTPLEPLISGTDLKDAFTPPPSTTGLSGNMAVARRLKIDYLLSPALSNKVCGGVYRKGMWLGLGPSGRLTTASRVPRRASDHAALWVDLDL